MLVISFLEKTVQPYCVSQRQISQHHTEYQFNSIVKKKQSSVLYCVIVPYHSALGKIYNLHPECTVYIPLTMLRAISIVKSVLHIKLNALEFHSERKEKK